MQAADVEKPVLDIRTGTERAYRGVADCLRALGDDEGALEWKKKLSGM